MCKIIYAPPSNQIQDESTILIILNHRIVEFPAIRRVIKSVFNLRMPVVYKAAKYFAYLEIEVPP